MIHLDHVDKSFTSRRGVAPVLRDMSLDVSPGEFVAIVGPSGCGKTTLLNLMVGLIRPDRGDVRVNGRPPQLGDPRIGYIAARDCLLPWLTARGNAGLALAARGMRGADRRRRASSALAQVGLAHATDRYPAQLSQGMRQRVAIARCLAAEPEILLLDEPFSALDAQTRLQAQALLLQLAERRRVTMVLVTHDLAEAATIADRVLLLTGARADDDSWLTVGLPRPRIPADLQADEAFQRLVGELWRRMPVAVADVGAP